MQAPICLLLTIQFSFIFRYTYIFAMLFDKLIKRGVPLYVVRILIFWYTTQTMYVRWNNVISSGFGVTNGVRQGGILSPYLFCVYSETSHSEHP